MKVEMGGKSQTGMGRSGKRGAERQKVRSREALMAVCRAGLWSMQEVVGAQESVRMCGRN